MDMAYLAVPTSLSSALICVSTIMLATLETTQQFLGALVRHILNRKGTGFMLFSTPLITLGHVSVTCFPWMLKGKMVCFVVDFVFLLSAVEFPQG